VTAPGKATSDGPSSARAADTTVVDDDRQISSQVRFINGDAGSLRKLLDRLKLIKQEADVTAWTLDDMALRDLPTQAQGDVRMNILQAPKVTSFNGAHAVIINCKKQPYVAGYDKVEDAARPFRPILKELEVGSKLDMTGVIVPGGTRLSVNVSDSWLLGLRTAMCEQRIGPEIVAADYHIPDMVDRKCQVACDIPEGSHLLISLGLSDPPKSPSTGMAGLVNGLFASIGLPQPIGFVPFERLVMITPRPIVLEHEERPIRPAARATAENEPT
jgi:hypothetical protein